MTTTSSNKERITALYVSVSGPLLNYLARRVSPVEDAADLLSETFIVAHRRATNLPADDEEARMWLFGVARRVLANHHRGSNRRIALADVLRATIRLSYVDDHEQHSDIREAITSLPANQRELIQLIHWDGFSIREAATLVKTTESTARGRYERAKKRLRERMTMSDATTTDRIISAVNASGVQ
ncbi:RNA polymerase sigma-70 factor (ECF subfamily) [Okibacterium sp. HSC-33S16]|uniref:RNA polymerase sigma factor n=1 Tax=Okibacterium sp. HSC-33S16 TaxID=2910965 RepID=UPI00209F7ED7|nr:sigma-70 family RNA polymerase sigma factor [Okibacterium sp. HSC-33S16]MCP2030356.1 RNA polymerase sigma-70 factor (ECF subfamily) [Okibacterium sp. HSC-33S16]